MAIEFVVFALGALLLLTGIIGGGFELKEIKIPRVGRVARVLSTTAGVILILMGIGMVAQPSLENQLQPPVSSAEIQPAAATFRIFDELGPNQLSEQVTILLDGKRIGNLTVSSEFPYSEITATVPEAGRYSYSIEATAYFFDAATEDIFLYTGVGQGMIQVDDKSSFTLVGLISGNLWLVTLVEQEPTH